MTETTDTATLCNTHEAGACPPGCPDAYAHDSRYTDEEIRSYTTAELNSHLTERRAQLQRSRNDLDRAHAELLEIIDPDTREYRDALADVGSYTREHATQRRIVLRLEEELESRTVKAPTMAELLERPAEPTASDVGLEFIEENVTNYLPGFDLSDDEADTLATTRIMWLHASIAIEAEKDSTATQREVADRVVKTWLTIYGMAD
jgi:hypothetical protein